jgi:hypothetical protein
MPHENTPELNNELDLEFVRATFPGWRLGGGPGHWFAVRGGVEATSGPRSLLRRCLSASTLMALADMLCLQEYLDGLSDEELADVWQQAGLPQSSGQAS